MNTATTYSPGIMRVPSAMGGLTSLFGMGRGGHPRQNHHKNVKVIRLKFYDIRLTTYNLSLTTYNSIKYILRKKS